MVMEILLGRFSANYARNEGLVFSKLFIYRHKIGSYVFQGEVFGENKAVRYIKSWFRKMNPYNCSLFHRVSLEWILLLR